MNFNKEWWRSGIKAWPYALLDLIFFVILLMTIKIDYNELGISQLTYSLFIVFISYFSIKSNEIFYDNVIKDMKLKGYFKNET